MAAQTQQYFRKTSSHRQACHRQAQFMMQAGKQQWFHQPTTTGQQQFDKKLSQSVVFTAVQD
jgi:hypothetical protein